MVEMAIVAPLLALLVAGILEYGTLWRDNLTVTSSTTRRIDSSCCRTWATTTSSDYEALLSLESGLRVRSTASRTRVRDDLRRLVRPTGSRRAASASTATGDPVGERHRQLQRLHRCGQVAAIGSASSCSVIVCRVPRATAPVHTAAVRSRWAFCPDTERDHRPEAVGLTSVGSLGTDHNGNVLHRDLPR